jgi:hypothetical protein
MNQQYNQDLTFSASNPIQPNTFFHEPSAIIVAMMETNEKTSGSKNNRRTAVSVSSELVCRNANERANVCLFPHF